MRPVERGPWPLDDQIPPQPLDFTDYSKARRWLYDRLGAYCSYCNRRLESAAVEHVRPKKPGGVHHPPRQRDWHNFLLACVNCNSTKGDEDVQLPDYFWPDSDNTMRAFAYTDSGRVRPAPGLSPSQRQIAQNTIALTGLDAVPRVDPATGLPTPRTDPDASDTRYERRRKVWQHAVHARRDLLRSNTPEDREDVRDLILESGYWPIWYHHLHDLPHMRDLLVSCLPGTAPGCFAPDGALLARPTGRI